MYPRAWTCVFNTFIFFRSFKRNKAYLIKEAALTSKRHLCLLVLGRVFDRVHQFFFPYHPWCLRSLPHLQRKNCLGFMDKNANVDKYLYPIKLKLFSSLVQSSKLDLWMQSLFPNLKCETPTPDHQCGSSNSRLNLDCPFT